MLFLTLSLLFTNRACSSFCSTLIPTSSSAAKQVFIMWTMLADNRMNFQDVHLQWQPWQERRKHRCSNRPGLSSLLGFPRRPYCSSNFDTFFTMWGWVQRLVAGRGTEAFSLHLLIVHVENSFRIVSPLQQSNFTALSLSYLLCLVRKQSCDQRIIILRAYCYGHA